MFAFAELPTFHVSLFTFHVFPRSLQRFIVRILKQLLHVVA